LSGPIVECCSDPQRGAPIAGSAAAIDKPVLANRELPHSGTSRRVDCW
jgi:hypothetical protein